MISLPGYLAVRRHVLRIRIAGGQAARGSTDDGRLVPFDAATSDGLFAKARQLGFSNEIAGYYHAVLRDCSSGLVDACRSLQLLQPRDTWTEGFRWRTPCLYHVRPLAQTVSGWPAEESGVCPAAAGARRSDALVRPPATGGEPPRLSLRALRACRTCLFRLHASGYNPPLNPLQTTPDDAYVRQLQYTDRLVGELLTGLEQSGVYDASHVVLLSDHGFRFGGRGGRSASHSLHRQEGRAACACRRDDG